MKKKFFLIKKNKKMSLSLDNLPLDLLYSIVIKSKNMFNICLINNFLNDKICNNNEFWKRFYLSYFGSPKIKISNWKLLYKDIITKKHCNEYIYPLNILKNEWLWNNDDSHLDQDTLYDEDIY